ncbi:MAG TPA: hypothetical protein VFQ32_02870 [Ktedonobacterales bacterium]|nr:hypothetical protein [Ktedonobacterales bacterium]
MIGQRIGRYLGWAFWLLDAAVIVAGLIIFMNAARVMGANKADALTGTIAMVVAFFTFPTMGALIIWQRPRNTVGWIFCCIGLGTAFTSFSAAFVQYALASHTDASLLVGVVDAAGNTVWPLNLGLGTFLLFLFPNGRLPSRRWRFIFWLDVAVVALAVLMGLLQPGYLESVNGVGRVWNPLGVTSAKPFFDLVNTVGGLVFVACALSSVAAIIVRYVTSRDIQRQQIKWFAFGVAMMVAILIPSFIFIPEENTLSNITFAVGIIMLPLGAGIGVLRYRLFDIDVIIRRTLVYGLLTAILASVYFVGVVGVQTLLRVSNSPFIIVITTLLIAALFQPLRRSLQRFIDQRFYRARYDARKTLDKFGASLRSEVELAQLTDHLLQTVEQTMRPAHVSLWLREPESERQP